MYISILFILVLLPFSCVFGEGLSTEEGDRRTLGPLFNPQSRIDWTTCSETILMTVYLFAQYCGGDRQVVITSCHRPHGRISSQHYKNNAIDFYLEYTSEDVVQQYYDDYKGFITFIELFGDHETRIGFGIYPPKDNENKAKEKTGELIFHYDHRGREARWAFGLDGKEISIEAGEQLLIKAIGA